MNPGFSFGVSESDAQHDDRHDKDIELIDWIHYQFLNVISCPHCGQTIHSRPSEPPL